MLGYNVCFAVGLICVIHCGYSPLKIDIDRELPVFSHEELSQYNGKDTEKPVYLAVKGVVFDVSEGRRFYGPGGNYHMMAGKDVSRAMATQELMDQDMTHDVAGLSDDQLQSLDNMFTKLYLTKYKKVGYMQYLLEENGKTEL
ncbi:DgyrCDS14242 [Dimorphilus gyrociliatus]|uniref:DgyrCDS14242 n=1 Tax=Dimorphilus gyrociliatus TaxID=2664684 RepID=A0A7I8WD32_9ANNE|nr:DgyrCDS14242 [Dimorphilus gyrociliatus]